MIKKTITFRDLDGNPLTEDFYFALNTAEITELVVVDKDLMSFFNKLENLKEDATVESVEKLSIDGAEVMTVFKKFIELSVGKRSEDGRRFIKNQEIRDDFLQTDAYSVLFVELCTNAGQAAEFVNGIVPSNFAEIVAQIEQANTTNAQTELSASTEPAWVTEGRIPTNDELKNATPEQIQLAFQRKTAETSQ